MSNNEASWEVVVVGAGAAGLLGAARAAARGRRTLLLEKNRKAGVKILMSGGTRCNLTQHTDRRGILRAIGRPARFLHSALAALGPGDLVRLIEAEGVPTKVEATGKVFPVSDRALDVLHALLAILRRSGATLALDEALLDVRPASDGAGGFLLRTSRRQIRAGRLLVTSGGQSYPACGTSGDGYRWATSLGHTLIPPRPALVPLTSGDPWLKPLQGITVEDVGLRLLRQQAGRTERLDQRRDGLLFTHFGLSGPGVLDLSRAVTALPTPRGVLLECDFLPHASAEEVDRALREEASRSGRKQLASLVAPQLPRRLVAALLEAAGVRAEQRGSELSRSQRQQLVAQLKSHTVPVHGHLGFKKAEVTAGGVALDEVDSRDMQSRLVPGLYFAGEILDLDGPIGGYNFQIAFSTGQLAGDHV